MMSSPASLDTPETSFARFVSYENSPNCKNCDFKKTELYQLAKDVFDKGGNFIDGAGEVMSFKRTTVGSGSSSSKSTKIRTSVSDPLRTKLSDRMSNI